MPTQGRTVDETVRFFFILISIGGIRMRYKQVKRGVFLARPNRFIAHVEVDGSMEVVHVKNTGHAPGIAGARGGGLPGEGRPAQAQDTV